MISLRQVAIHCRRPISVRVYHILTVPASLFYLVGANRLAACIGHLVHVDPGKLHILTFLIRILAIDKKSSLNVASVTLCREIIKFKGIQSGLIHLKRKAHRPLFLSDNGLPALILAGLDYTAVRLLYQRRNRVDPDHLAVEIPFAVLIHITDITPVGIGAHRRKHIACGFQFSLVVFGEQVYNNNYDCKTSCHQQYLLPSF